MYWEHLPHFYFQSSIKTIITKHKTVSHHILVTTIRDIIKRWSFSDFSLMVLTINNTKNKNRKGIMIIKSVRVAEVFGRGANKKFWRLRRQKIYNIWEILPPSTYHFLNCICSGRYAKLFHRKPAKVVFQILKQSIFFSMLN